MRRAESRKNSQDWRDAKLRVPSAERQALISETIWIEKRE